MKHGTPAGYNRHRLDNEPACDLCLTAKVDAGRAHRAETAERMQLPVGLIARLYVSVPVALQTAVEDYLSPKVVDVLVRRLDDAERDQRPADLTPAGERKGAAA